MMIKNFRCIYLPKPDQGLNCSLSGLDTLCRFSAIFCKGDDFCNFLFAFLYIKPPLKKVHSKRKEFAPFGSKFFPFWVDQISIARQNNFDRVSSPESISIPLKIHNPINLWANSKAPGPEVIKLFSCSTQLSTKISLLINMKMPTIVGIFIFISREIFMLSYV